MTDPLIRWKLRGIGEKRVQPSPLQLAWVLVARSSVCLIRCSKERNYTFSKTRGLLIHRYLNSVMTYPIYLKFISPFNTSVIFSRLFWVQFCALNSLMIWRLAEEKLPDSDQVGRIWESSLHNWVWKLRAKKFSFCMSDKRISRRLRDSEHLSILLLSWKIF